MPSGLDIRPANRAACTDLDRNTTTLARWIAKERPDAVHVRTMQRNIRLPGLTTADAIETAVNRRKKGAAKDRA